MSNTSLPIVTFDNTSAASDKNLRTVRPHHQSPIDNTKSGIVNLGSKTTGASAGATGNYSSIGGGDQNTASGAGATVPGGTGNTASGINSHAEGQSTTASGLASHAQGIGAVALRAGQHADTAFSGSGIQHGTLTVGATQAAFNAPTDLHDALGHNFILELSKTYAIKVRLVVAAVGVGAPIGAQIVHDLLVRTDGAGNAFIDDDNLTLNQNVPGYVFQFTITTIGGPQLHLEFTNVTPGLGVNVGATIDWTEVANT